MIKDGLIPYNNNQIKADNNNTIEIIDGDKYNVNTPQQSKDKYITFTGQSSSNPYFTTLSYSQKMLSRHMLLLGGIGTGKTNTFYHMIDLISKKLTDDDVMIIFDTKGDFFKNFKKPGDIVICNDNRATDANDVNYWNIFSEIDPSDIDTSIREISRSLFKDSLEKTSNSYFPNAASDIFYALMKILYKYPDVNNQILRNLINRIDSEGILHLISKSPDLQFAANHISDPKSPQTQGVIAEMDSVLNKLFVGNFAKKGNISISELVKNRGGKKIFIEYDVKTGEVLIPIYNLMMDLAIKQALSSNNDTKGSIYFFIDEFKLLPQLEHIDDAVNFGRSLGIKMFVGLQAVTQIYDSYGEYRAKSILSGFLNTMFFRVNNHESREFIKQQFGEHVEKISYKQQNGIGDHVMKTDVVKDKDIIRLKVGEAIIGIPGAEPFSFRFNEWKMEE